MPYSSSRHPDTGLARLLICLALLAWALAAGVAGVRAQTQAPTAVQVSVQDVIGPATADHIIRHLDQAVEADASLFIIELDTPGGLDSSMRAIIQAILRSPIPVATFVSPAGARAASAGTFILYASHIAAMVPASNLGAASPVSIGMNLQGNAAWAQQVKSASSTSTAEASGVNNQPATTEPSSNEQGRADDAAQDNDAVMHEPEEHKGDESNKSSGEGKDTEKGKDDDKPASSQSDILSSKATSDAAAYLRSLAQLRGRNADFAEQAVRDASSLSAQEALDQGVIDYVAVDVPALLSQLDGAEITLSGTNSVTLSTAGMSVQNIETSLRTRLLSLLTNPQLAVILMMIGVYGLFFELTSPGFALPGVAGIICLVLAMYAFHMLPINWAGVALLLVGAALMIAEVFMPSFGALGIGGLIAFVLGGTFLTDSDTDLPGFDLSLPFMAGVGAASLALILLGGGLAARAYRRPVVTGEHGMIGQGGVVTGQVAGKTYARVAGEQWHVVANQPLQVGQHIRVVAIDGLTLQVETTQEITP